MVKQIHRLNKNHKGSSLILVIFCMVFIGVLASAVLTATVSNMKMKTVDAFAKDNFYTAEMAMDELKAGFDEIAQEKLKEAYAFMLNKYTVTPETERSKHMRTKWANLFYELLAKVDSGTESELDDDILDVFLITAQPDLFDTTTTLVVKDLSTSNPSVTIKDITLMYTDANGFKTTITTDLKFTATSAALGNQNASHNGVYFTDFALIADNTIINNSLGKAVVNASIYGANGIIATGRNSDTVYSELDLTSKRIVSRENLEVKEKGKIVIRNIGEGATLDNQVWVKNIVTTKNDPWGASEQPIEYFNIHANCYVSDDLTLNAKGGNVTIKGNYYGYNSDIIPVVANYSSDFSSSIVVNASKATLDLSDLNRLWIAGKNFLAVPNVYGGVDPTSYQKIAEGESLTFKGSQVAYLVPGNCIIGVGHNPMTLDDYNNNFTSLDFSLYTDLTLDTYLNPSVQYKTAFVNYLDPTGDTMQMVYLYLNFLSPDHASDYFHDYMSIAENRNKLLGIANDMELADIKVPASGSGKILNTGNLMKYDGSTISYRERKNEDGALIPYNDPATVEDKELFATPRYHSLISYLQERNSMTVTPSLVRTLVRFDDETINGVPYRGITSLVSPGGIVYTVGDLNNSTPASPYILVSHQPTDVISISGGTKYGIIITTADVKVENCTFVGMIITTGDINLGAGSIVKSDEANIKDIIENDANLYELFRDYDVINSSIESSVISLSYENWQKK